METKVDILNIIKIALKAGKGVLRYYGQKSKISYKSDQSPITKADLLSHQIIQNRLKSLDSNLPIISEEGTLYSYEERKHWNAFWLVDPLDGTKEFINRNGEFTINIALIEDNIPILGVVYAPSLDILYFADKKLGSFKLENIKNQQLNSMTSLLSQSKSLPLQKNKNTIKVAVSRSHLSDKTNEYIQNISQKYPDKPIETYNIGSSLKFCIVAEGIAHLYPRFTPTMEWDTAAGHAIVKYANGKVHLENEKDQLLYNKESLKNPPLIALCKGISTYE